MNRHLRLIAIFFAGFFLLIGCSDEDVNNNHNQKNGDTNNNRNHNTTGDTSDDQTQHDNEDNETEAAEDMVVETDDGKVTFTLRNESGLSETTMETLKKRVLNAYDYVKESIDTPYTPQDDINIFLEDGTISEYSSGGGGNITLNGSEINMYPIIHEMTHTILGYGGEDGKLFDMTRGFVTQEGFADYLQDERGTALTQSWSDSFMKILLSEERVLPLESLIDPVPAQKYFRSYYNSEAKESELLMNLSYIHAASFVRYLIEEYGIDKFENVYNQADLETVLEETYGKSVSELENEWHTHIEEIENDFVYDNYKENEDQFNEWFEDIDAIDSDMFKQ